MRIILTFILLIYLAKGDLLGQTKTITGLIVSEELEAIPAVSIHLKNSTIFGQTDIDGRFTIELPENTDSLLLSFIGFESTTIKFQEDCDTLEVILMVHVIYDFMSLGRINRLRKKRFKKLTSLHTKAYEKGIFKTEKPCYHQEFNPYFK